MALLGWPGRSLVDIQDTLHTTYVHLPKCPANKIGPLSVFVFYHFPNVPPWGYSSLEPTIGLFIPLSECHDTSLIMEKNGCEGAASGRTR